MTIKFSYEWRDREREFIWEKIKHIFPHKEKIINITFDFRAELKIHYRELIPKLHSSHAFKLINGNNWSCSQNYCYHCQNTEKNEEKWYSLSRAKIAGSHKSRMTWKFY